MNLDNGYQIGFQRAMEGEEFISPLEIAASVSESSDEFCKLWELYEHGYAEATRVRYMLDYGREDEVNLSSLPAGCSRHHLPNSRRKVGHGLGYT